jgi:hypothetical protein
LKALKQLKLTIQNRFDSGAYFHLRLQCKHTHSEFLTPTRPCLVINFRLTYWTIFAIVSAVEALFSALLLAIPFYSFLKLALLAACVSSVRRLNAMPLCITVCARAQADAPQFLNSHPSCSIALQMGRAFIYRYTIRPFLLDHHASVAAISSGFTAAVGQTFDLALSRLHAGAFAHQPASSNQAASGQHSD